MLVNASFDGGTTHDTFTGQEFGEITVPEGWTAFWDPNQGRPEMKVIEARPPFLDPPRLHERIDQDRLSEKEYLEWLVDQGWKALQDFTRWRTRDSGIYQQIEVEPDSIIEAAVWGHSWYTTEDNKYLSQYGAVPIKNGDPGILMMLGIDPGGGTDPWASSVHWTNGNIYDHFAQLNVVAQAKADRATIFLRSKVEHPFAHCDTYWDNVSMRIIPTSGTGCKPRPGWTHRTTVLVHPDAPVEVFMGACAYAAGTSRRHSVDWSWDHAFYAPGLESVLVKLYQREPYVFDPAFVRKWAQKYYPDTNWYIEEVWAEAPPEPEPEPEPEPDPDWKPVPWITKGSSLGFHTDGDGGQSEIAQACAEAGSIYNTAKFVADPGPAELVAEWQTLCETVGRYIDIQGYGKVEGFNADLPPIPQAEERFRVLRDKWLEHDDIRWWEMVNEEHPDTPDGMVAFALFNVRMMELAETIGKRILCFSWSTGRPALAAFGDALDTYEVMAQTGIFDRMMQTPDGIPHGVSAHAYGRLDLNGAAQMLRQDYLYENYIIPRAQAQGQRVLPPLFITEYGVERHDLGEGEDFLFSECVNYDRQFRTRPYAAGIHIYKLLADEDYYNAYTPIFQRLKQYIVREGL
jgi:hypothetical protein